MNEQIFQEEKLFTAGAVRILKGVEVGHLMRSHMFVLVLFSLAPRDDVSVQTRWVKLKRISKRRGVQVEKTEI